MSATHCRALLATFVLSLGLLSTSMAAAQGRHKAQAGELAAQAREAFGSKSYLQAAELLSQAFDAYPEPNFVWNTARAYDLAGEWEQAEEAYRRFANLDVSEEERGAALDAAASLKAARTLPELVRGAQDGAELVALRGQLARFGPRQVTSRDNGSVSGQSIAGWAATASGIVALGGVLTLHLASLSTVDDYNEAASSGDKGRYDALHDTLQSRVLVSQVLGLSGIVLLGSGLTLLTLEALDEPATPTIQAAATPGVLGFGALLTPVGAQISVGGAF